MNTNSASQYTYEELFQRNIGVFTPEEQEKIKNLKVAIVGAGGLGGPVAILLTRLGVGEIRIADPDKFEPSNINRQFGAYIDTIGRNKAEVIGEEINRINPFLKTTVLAEGINSNNLSKFICDADCIVDAIDFYAVNEERFLHREAVKRGQWIFSAQNAGTLFSVIVFNPKGKNFEDLFVSNDKVDISKVIGCLFPVLPAEATPEAIQKIINGEQLHITALATAPPLGGSFLVEEMIKVLVKKDKAQFIEAPDLFMVDITNRKFIIYKNGEIKNNV